MPTDRRIDAHRGRRRAIAISRSVPCRAGPSIAMPTAVERGRALLLELVLLDEPDQVSPRDLELLGGPRLVAVDGGGSRRRSSCARAPRPRRAASRCRSAASSSAGAYWRMRGDSSAASIVGESPASTTRRSISFSSSRTLPGHGYDEHLRLAVGRQPLRPAVAAMSRRGSNRSGPARRRGARAATAASS